MVPDDLVGAWRRVGLLLNGVRVVDYCDVLWLQTSEWYADFRLRIPGSTSRCEPVPEFFDAERAFAGVTTFTDGVISWQHVLDSRLDPVPDSSPISWHGRVLVEPGISVIGSESVGYVEQWTRISGDDPQWAVQRRESGVRIELDTWAIEIDDHRPTGGFAAKRCDLSDASCAVIRSGAG